MSQAADRSIRAEEALRETQQRFAAFMDHLPGAAWMKDLQGRYVYANPEAERIFSRSRAEIAGKTDAEIFPPETARHFVENDRRALAEGSVHTTEALRQADGIEHHSIVHKFAVPGPDGQAQCIGGVAFDITERKRAEEARLAALARAEQASQAKDHFLAMLSHELRNPLAPVMTAAAMLKGRLGADPAARELVEMITRNVELEARLIDDLLDMTRIARGKVELDLRPVALCQVLQRTTEVCMSDIKARRLHFDVRIDKPPHFVHADTARLQQVFWNLLQNAVKFTPHGGCVGVHCWRENGQVVVEVSDSGEGVESEALGRIVDAFEQAERAVTRRFGGLGLGLTISKALVELHGGTIQARSEGKGKGAAFTVRLPLIAVGADAHPAAPAEQPAGRAVRPLRILLVEDHGDTAQMTRLSLMMDGHSVDHAGDVAIALEMADQHSFDLLISDLGLPDATGLELIRQLRARGQTLPGIALSGYGTEQDIQRSHEAGFAIHLTKPIGPERLVEAIAAVTG